MKRRSFLKRLGAGLTTLAGIAVGLKLPKPTKKESESEPEPEKIGTVFDADKITYRVRHIYHVSYLDNRPIYYKIKP